MTLEEVRAAFERIKIGWVIAGPQERERYQYQLAILASTLRHLVDTADPLLTFEINDLADHISSHLKKPR